MKIILGSKSKGRKQILQNLGYDFVVMDPNIDEKSIRDSDPKKLVTLLAKAKAAALLPVYPPFLVPTESRVFNHFGSNFSHTLSAINHPKICVV